MTSSLVRGRRLDRERLSAFDALIAAPHDLGASGPLVMPASARLALSHSAALTLGQITISITPGRVGFSHPSMVADDIYKGAWAEEGTRVSQADAPAGTLTLYLVNPIDGGKLVPIASLVVV